MRLIIMLTLLPLFLSTTIFSAEVGLTDKEAKAFIENLWSTSHFAIKLGSMTVVAKNTDIAKNRISEEVYKALQAYEKVGIIKISVVKSSQDLLKGDWNDHLAYNLGGVRGQIVITKTDAGETLAKKGGLPQKDGWLVIRQGIFRVDEIIKNEARRKGIDNYRIIMATYTAEWTPELKRAQEMRGKQLSEKRKVIMLIKFDPFSSTWKDVAHDLANTDEDFTTNNVSRALGE